MKYSINLDKYPQIYQDKFGGNIEIFKTKDSLSEFTADLKLGFIQILDMTLYELSKYSQFIASRDDLNLSIDQYSKHLRHLFPSFPYRYFGFINIRSIKRYLEDFYKKRSLDLHALVEKELISLNYFKNTISSIIKEDHVILVEDRSSKSLCKYYNIYAIDEFYLYIILNGEKEKLNFKSLDFYNLSFLYLQINL